MTQTIGVLCLLASAFDVSIVLAGLASAASALPAVFLVPLGVTFLRPASRQTTR